MKKPEFPFLVGQMITVYKKGKDCDKVIIEAIERKGTETYMKTRSQGHDTGAVVYYVLEAGKDPRKNNWYHSKASLTGQYTTNKNLRFSFAPRL